MRDKARVLLAFLLPGFVAVLLLLSVFLLVYSYLISPRAFNSDNLLCPAQCDDLLHGREVTEWHLPGAPYVFPDLLLLLPCQWLTPTLPVAFLAYGLVLHLSLAAILTWLGRLSGLHWPTALTAAGCGVLLLATANLGSHCGGRNCLLVHPGSHVGAILIGLFLLALTVHCLRRGQSWMAATAYLIVGGLGAFSDKLLLPQFLAPLALALIVLMARKVISRRQAGALLALLGASFLLSLTIQNAFHRLGFHLLEVETAPGRLRLPDLFRMLRGLGQGIADDYLLCALLPLHLLAAMLVVWSRLRRSEETPTQAGIERPAILLAALTIALSPLCILGTLFCLNMAHLPAISRYTLSCCFLPALLLPLLLCWLPGRTARSAQVLLSLGIMLFALQRAAVLLPSIDATKFEQPYPPLAQALDRLARERGPLRGLGGYWLARSTDWFCRERVTVNPLSPQGEPWFHGSNPARFLAEDGDNLRLPHYQFLLVHPGDPFGPTPVVLNLHFGQPAEKITVGSDQIWLYDSLRVSLFDRFLRSRLAERLQAHRPHTGPIEPACLAHAKPNLTPADAPGNVLLDPDHPHEVRFARPITGQLLDLGANFDDRMDLEFYRGKEHLANLPVPSVPWNGCAYGKPGIQSRLLPLPPALRGQSWDRILVRPRLGTEQVRLAHLLVFAEDVPGLDEDCPVPHPGRLRFEAEELFPLNPGTPYTDDADPAASAGRVRRNALDLRCCFSYTPRLVLPPGRYRLECALKVDANTSSEEVASLCVNRLSPSMPLVKRAIRGTDFPTPGRWAALIITFEIHEDAESIQFGIASTGRTPITADYLELIEVQSQSQSQSQGSGIRGQESGIRSQESRSRGQETTGSSLPPASCLLTPDS